ncbi:MAG: hypothetical protein ACXVL8_18875, partial [Acidimicrobiia bacterium]
MPLRASNHEKFSVFVAHGGATAIVGSGDFAQMYWDRTAHEPTDPRRYKRSSPAHEVAVLV